MICAACGSANDVGLKFCNNCGAPLSATCPECSAPNRPGSRFCGECGSPLVAVSDRPAASAAERRVVSVLFADLVGFTTLSQNRDAEDVRELLSQYFDAARVAVERHGGIVEKFIGDAVMAVWGTERAHEDDAERAVRAAFELIESVVALGAALGIDLNARTGVLTGEAAVTVGAQGQGLVAGDLVNTASRLQSAAEPGTVLVGAATYHAASDAIAFEGLGKVSVKGKDVPIDVWRAVRVVAQRGGGGRPGRPEPPFVGRAEDLRLVKDLLHVTAREQRPRLVSITGIGGIGKSRLALEFKNYVDGLAADVYWHQGRCPAYGEGITFWALGEMVRMRAGIAETDDPEVARRSLTAMIEAEIADADEQRWLEPRLAHLLGLGEAAAGDRDELFAAWRAMFERIAAKGVTVMVFEDLHWADGGLLDFVESILEWSKNSAILVVTLARPELLDRRPTWGAGLRNYTTLHLDPLDAVSMSELVNGFVADLPAADTGRIVARAEGVPLYAVETLRMLADRGALIVDGDCYRLTSDIGDLDVPGSLHALIAARLDVLPADDRDLLRDAAVLGTSFTVESLAAIRDASENSIEPRLRDLVRRDFLAQDTDPRSPARGQFSFLQGIIREVAYGTLSKADRRRKHLTVAEHFERLDDDEVAGVVASHYVEALRATPDGLEADELSEKVRQTVSDAARRALSLGSPEQALTYVDQALDITPERERGPLLELAGQAAFAAAVTERAVDYLTRATSVFADKGDAVAVARVAVLMTRLMQMQDVPGAAEMLGDALDALPAEADIETRARVLCRRAEVLNDTGRAADAFAHAEEALTLAEKLGDDELFIECLSRRAAVLFVLGRHREALLLAHGAVDIAAESGSRHAYTLALLELSVMLSKDNQRDAYNTMRASAAAARKSGIRPIEQISLANALEAAIDLGLFDEADAIEAELRSFPGLDHVFGASVTLNSAVLAAYRGDPAGAAEQLASIEARFSLEGRQVAEITWHLRAVSLVRLLSGDAVGAYAAGVEAVELDPAGMNAASALGGLSHAAAWLRDADRLADTLSAMKRVSGEWIQNIRGSAAAALDALDGRTDEATAGFRAVLSEWDRLDMPLDYSWAVVDALSVLPVDLIDVDAVRRARAFLASIGATPLLGRLDAAVATTVD